MVFKFSKVHSLGAHGESVGAGKSFGRKSGFTLVELLVSIAIVAILASLLLSAANKVRAASQNVTCVNNLRQFGIGIAAYMGENNGQIYPTCPQSSWFWLGDEPWGAFTAYDGAAFAPYVGNAMGIPQLSGARKGLLYCPSIRADFPGSIPTTALPNGCLGYAMNHWMYSIKPSLGRPTKAFDFGPNPSKKLVLVDAVVPDLGVESFNGNALPPGAFRHNHHLNGLFLDGHVGALSPEDVSTTQLLKTLVAPEE